MKLLRNALILTLMLLMLGIGVGAAQDDLSEHTFSDGTTVRFPADWLIDGADDTGDFLALDNDEHFFFFQLYTVEVQTEFDLAAVPDAMADAYLPADDGDAFDADAVERVEVENRALSLWRYGDTPGTVMALKLRNDAILVLDAFNVGPNSPAENLGLSILLNADGANVDVSEAARILDNYFEVAVDADDDAQPPRADDADDNAGQDGDDDRPAQSRDELPDDLLEWVGEGCFEGLSFQYSARSIEEVLVFDDAIVSLIGREDFYFIDLEFLAVYDDFSLEEIIVDSGGTDVEADERAGFEGLQFEYDDLVFPAYAYVLNDYTQVFIISDGDPGTDRRFNPVIDVLLQTIELTEDFGETHEACLYGE